MISLRRRILLLVVGLACTWAQAVTDSDLIILGQGFGRFRAALGEAGIQALLEESDVGYEGEGFSIYFLQPERRIDVSVSAQGHIREMRIHGSASAWHTAEGISLGSPLLDLEKANGKPFSFRSFEGERGGEVVDWHGGRLQGLRCVFATPFQAPSYGELSEEEKLALEKPGTLASDEPLSRRLNPIVETLALTFP